MDDRLLYCPADAARLLSIGRSTLYELLDSGALPSVKIGRARRIPREALFAYLDGLPS
ncbi:helix-turn-helix domain-containing protein [Isoptericola sp. b490]|uniref:helix-turn-helix domain-containing protein n=1 Tax=Actinotalea lenta TaxID=3064654 RepID=UPI0027129C63|nr:helix-turn-helix domain-containing protein [Isoptericola sp. b490]MDO8120639.1 helix-turn-helix domain-containing protein [Isoptericola sp. b490]